MSEAEDTKPTETKPDTTESDARARGWVPKEEYTGKREWKSAEEYLNYGDQSANELRRELAETKAALLEFGKANRDAAREEARKAAEAKLDEAVESGDKDAARKAAIEVRREAEPVVNEMPASAKSFIDRNKEWFGFHERATEYARSRERRLMSEGLSLDEVYARIDEDVRARFPEVVDDQPQKRERPAAVEPGGTRRVRPKQTSGLTINDLPEQYQKIARDFVKRKVLTEDQYIQSLIDDGTLRVQ